MASTRSTESGALLLPPYAKMKSEKRRHGRAYGIAALTVLQDKV
jgi:hypothetical protein